MLLQKKKAVFPWRQGERQLTGSCSAEHTALITETMSVLLVKWLSPRRPLSCCSPMTMAAPAMNPTMAACDRKSTRNPSLGHDEPTLVKTTCVEHFPMHAKTRRQNILARELRKGVLVIITNKLT